MPSDTVTNTEHHESTRQRLLDAAERHFAEHGFDGARVRDITADAECNVASVNYHFGGKEKLYLAMFQRRLSALRDQRVSCLTTLLERAGDDLTLEQVVGTFTRVFLEPLMEAEVGRRVMLLFTRERLDPRLPQGMFYNQMVRPTENALIAALCRVCPRLDQQHARLSAFSLIAQLVLATHVMGKDPGPGSHNDDEPDLDTLIDHIARFSCGALQSLAGKVT